MGVFPGGPGPEYLSVKEAAAELGISVRQVYRLIRSGRLRAERIPGSGGWRIPRSSLWTSSRIGPHRVSLEQIYELLVDVKRLLEGAGPCHCSCKPTGGQ